MLDANSNIRKFTKDYDVISWIEKNDVTKNVFGYFYEDKSAIIDEPYKYNINVPIIYYGSSITQGACASRSGNSYQAFISRWIDGDYINLGFSGNAKGEESMARYISELKMSVFVMDYDYNAPTIEHLRQTHYNFYKIIRERQPLLPIILISKPDFDNNTWDSSVERRKIIEQTYNHALKNQDKNIYFINGKNFFDEGNRENCFIYDQKVRNGKVILSAHPNDLGFYLIAKTIYKLLKKIIN